MDYKRVLTVQDISCFGQCSLTVALPILSAAGHETVILPSAVLSTHTGGFSGFTFCDLTGEIPKITEHWLKEGIKFDAIYTGYLGSTTQIGYVKSMFKTLGKDKYIKIVDPAMADNGKLYTGFNAEFVNEMKKLVYSADIILPNITEACFLTDTEYKEKYDEAYIDMLLSKLTAAGAKTVILTGVSYSEDSTGVLVYENGIKRYYKHRRNKRGSHGTGDVYASAFVGAYLKNNDVYKSAVIAADYTLLCIENTADDDSHRYGVKFEPVLPQYIESLK
ncbi:MAG: pyridoxamine kinase [Clostridia bacterium]|nr:pyridoxamine kinase [Clostridia bacterium]